MDKLVDWTTDSDYQRIQRDIVMQDRLLAIRDRLVSCESVCQRDIVEIESTCPGLIMDTPPSGGFTIEPSQQNYQVTLESLERYRTLLVGSALVAILGFLWRIFGFGSGGGSGGSGGGGSGGGRDYPPMDKYITDSDASLQAGKQSASNIQHMVTTSSSLTAEFKKDAIHHLALAGLTDDEITKILTDESTARKYICGPYLEDVQWHSLTHKLYGIIVEGSYAVEQQKLQKLIEGLLEHIADRYRYVVDTYVFLDTQIAKLRTDQPDHTHPPLPADTTGDIAALRTYLNAPADISPNSLANQFSLHVSGLKSNRGVAEARAKLLTYHEWHNRAKTFISTCKMANVYIESNLAKRTDVSKYATSLQEQVDQLNELLKQWENGRAPANPANDSRIALVKHARDEYLKAGNAVTMTSTHILQGMTSLAGMANTTFKAFVDSQRHIEQARAWLVGIETRLRNATTN